MMIYNDDNSLTEPQDSLKWNLYCECEDEDDGDIIAVLKSMLKDLE